MVAKLTKHDKVSRGLQVIDDEFFKTPTLVVCCNCGLTHWVTAKIKDDVVYLKFKVESKETKQERAKLKPITSGWKQCKKQHKQPKK